MTWAYWDVDEPKYAPNVRCTVMQPDGRWHAADCAEQHYVVCECPHGFFGHTCDAACHCRDGAPCNGLTGRCSDGCAADWQGQDCSQPLVCPVGAWGFDCRQLCFCAGNEACDKDTGSCAGGCQTGWTGPACDTITKAPCATAVELGGFCFFDVAVALPVAGARRYCALHNASLANVADRKSVAWIRENLFGNETSIPYPYWRWVGASDEATEGVMRWTTGRPIDRVDWRPGSPSSGDESDCVVLGVDFVFQDVRCRITDDTPTEFFLCQYPDPGYTCDREEDACGDFVHRHAGMYQYFVTPEPIDYLAARDFCALARIDTRQDNEAAFAFAQASGDVWIGANDDFPHGVFRWGDGYVLTWTNWAAGSPYYDEKTCVYLRGDRGDWSSDLCGEKKLALCECLHGSFGATCDGRCHCRGNEPCEGFTGACPADCADGWTGTTCSTRLCPTGWFGPACGALCFCAGAVGCDVDDGTCPDGCATGWTGPSCNQLTRPPCEVSAELGSCFVDVQKNLQRGAAVRYCAALNASLANVPDGATVDFIKRHVFNDSEEIEYPYFRWVGATDEPLEGVMRWTTGRPMDFANWRVGFPQSGDGFDCVIFGLDYAFEDIPCSTDDGFDVEFFLCQYPDPGNTCAAEKDGCGDFIHRPAGSYQFFLTPEVMTYAAGRDFCNPARIDTRQDNEAAFAHVSASGDAWIGANDDFPHGVFRWNDGYVLTWTHWATGSPVYDDHACVFMESGRGFWTSGYCDEPKRVLCECIDGTFGPGCDRQCHCAGNEPCEGFSGACPAGCASGWEGPTCSRKLCGAGSFGENCEFFCFCAAAAAGSVACNSTTGACPAGCADGWAGPSCNVRQSLPCEPSVGLDGTCFFDASELRLTRSLASEYCAAHNSTLVNVHSADVSDFLRDQLFPGASSAPGWYWTGAMDSEVEGVIRWSTGNPLTFVRWHPGSPSAGNARDCFLFGSDDAGGASDFRMKDADCGAPNNFICQFPDPGETCTDFIHDGCGTFKPRSPGRFYYFASDGALSWPEAMQHCNVARIDTSADNEAATAAAAAVASGPVWIGATGANVTGVFRWADGVTLSWANWAAGSPRYVPESKCSQLDVAAGTWSSVDCGGRAVALCECLVGAFGPKCNGVCHCRDNVPCHPATGSCLAGCDHGWAGPSCSQRLEQPCQVAPPGDRCFFAYSSDASHFPYAVAGNACRNVNGSLAKMDDVAARDAIRDQVFGGGDVSRPFIYWIGARDVDVEGTWRWEDGTLLTWSEWRLSHPKPGAADCLTVGPEMALMDAPCDGEYAFVCQFPAQRENSCDVHDEFERCTPAAARPGLFFRLSDDAVPFSEADDACSPLATARIDSLDEHLTALRAALQTEAWIGLSRSTSGASWRWLSGHVVTFANWLDASEPNARAGSNCTFVLASGSWAAADCENRKRVLCEGLNAAGSGTHVTFSRASWLLAVLLGWLLQVLPGFN